MTYAEFCREAQRILSIEEMASTETVEDATKEEVQWWKGWQVRRAIRHKGAGNPTREDLELLEQKTTIVISSADYRAARVRETTADRQNADKYFPLESFK